MKWNKSNISFRNLPGKSRVFTEITKGKKAGIGFQEQD